MWLMCNKEITQFYLPPTHGPYFSLYFAVATQLPFDRYQVTLCNGAEAGLEPATYKSQV